MKIPKRNIIQIKLLVVLLCFYAPLNAQVKKHKPVSYDPSQVPNVRSKEIVREFPCNSNVTVSVQNIMRKINVVACADEKVRLVTTVYYRGESSLTDDQWLSKMELSISGNKDHIEIKSGIVSKTAPRSQTRVLDTIFNGISIFDSLGNALNRRTSMARNIVLYVPAGAKVDIDSKYADVILEDNMVDVVARITNGSMTMTDAKQLNITSSYGNIYARHVGRAQMDVANGKLTARRIDTLDINSKNSSVDIDRIDLLKIKSQIDQFFIGEAKYITGQKNYGDLRLMILTGSIDLSGVNTDLKIRRIDSVVTAIKMTTRYADLRLPVGELKNYTVAFEGAIRNVYAPFEKIATTDASFKASVGSKDEKPTVFQLACDNCSVDFK